MKTEADKNGDQVSHEQAAQAIAADTLLSDRQAELYVLINQFGCTIQEAADEMNISYGNASGKLSLIRQKIADAERTAELEI